MFGIEVIQRTDLGLYRSLQGPKCDIFLGVFQGGKGQEKPITNTRFLTTIDYLDRGTTNRNETIQDRETELSSIWYC